MKLVEINDPKKEVSAGDAVIENWGAISEDTLYVMCKQFVLCHEKRMIIGFESEEGQTLIDSENEAIKGIADMFVSAIQDDWVKSKEN